MSSVEWAPELPKGWSGASLKWLARIYAGGTPDRANLDYWTNGTIPWLNSGSVNDWSITEPSELISEAGLAGSSARWVPPGSVVIGLAGQGKTKGTAARLEFMATTNQSMAAIVPTAVLNYRYLHYWLASNYQSIRNLAGGDLRDGLNLQHIGSIQVPLPSPTEQSAIADYLDRETAQLALLIAKQEALIGILLERRAAVVRRSIPHPAVEWRLSDRLGRYSRIGNGSTPRRENLRYWAGGTFPWLNSAVVNQDRVVTSDQFVTTDALVECHLPVVTPGCLLVGLTGQGKTRGMATVLDIEATVSQHVAYISPDRTRWDGDYLLWALRASYGDLRALSDENGSTKGGLTCEGLKAFRIVMPTLDEQRRTAAYLNDQTAKIDALIAKAQKFIVLAKERRDALITAAVTGQLDIGEAA